MQVPAEKALRRVGVAHPGTQHSWETALAFQEGDRLGWYATSSYYQPSRWPDRAVSFMPFGLRKRVVAELMRRRHDRLDDDRIRRHTSTEALERALRLAGRPKWAERVSDRRHANFPQKVIALLEREPIDILWSPHDCLEVFDWAQRRGILCVLDQPIGHYASLDRVLREEYERHPDFFINVGGGVGPELKARQARAAHVADIIVVGSPFAAETMVENGTDPAKVRVVPYGYNEKHYDLPRPERTPLKDRPIEFLFVGIVGARKGLAYLLEAFRQIDPSKARLTIVGPLDMPPDTFARYADHVNYLGQVKRWEVVEHMRAADCFIFPSLFEGGGIVLYEAAAAGMGIIQTRQCGDGVRDQRNGHVLDEVSVEAIRTAVDEVVRRPDMLIDWAEQSWAMRKERSWSVYRETVNTLV